MSMSKNTLYALIAAVLAFIGYCFSFLSASAMGYSVSVASGFTFAFSFAAFSAVLTFIVFWANIVTIVLMIIRKQGPWGIIFYVLALLQLIAIITLGSVSEYGVSAGAGFGFWWSFIFFIIAGTLHLFGKKLNLSKIPVDKIKSSAQQVAHNVSQTVAQATAEDKPAANDNIKYCSECGARIAADSKFCPKCGKQC